MNLPQARRAFHARWIFAFGWVLVTLIYLDWLFFPLTSGEWSLWAICHPSYYVFCAFKGLTGLDWLDCSMTGLTDAMVFYPSMRRHYPPEDYPVAAILFCLIIGLAVWAFVGGESRGHVVLPALRKPSWRAVTVTAFMAGLLTFAIEAVALEKLQLWPELVRSFLHALWQTHRLYNISSYDMEAYIWRPGLPIFLLDWGFWFVILGLCWRRGQRYWLLESMTRCLLLAGLAVWFGLTIYGAAGFYTQNDNGSIYGSRALGSLYASKALAVTVILWAWTCRLILLFQLRKFERQSNENICFACGYDLRASPGACPECGAARPIKSSPPIPNELKPAVK